VHRDAEELAHGRAGLIDWTATWHTTTVPARSWLAHHPGPTGHATYRSDFRVTCSPQLFNEGQSVLSAHHASECIRCVTSGLDRLQLQRLYSRWASGRQFQGPFHSAMRATPGKIAGQFAGSGQRLRCLALSNLCFQPRKIAAPAFSRSIEDEVHCKHIAACHDVACLVDRTGCTIGPRELGADRYCALPTEQASSFQCDGGIPNRHE
jgi:hypothetical protein